MGNESGISAFLAFGSVLHERDTVSISFEQKSVPGARTYSQSQCSQLREVGDCCSLGGVDRAETVLTYAPLYPVYPPRISYQQVAKYTGVQESFHSGGYLDMSCFVA